MEIWKDIPGYDGYQASSNGMIRSIDRIVDYKNRICKRKGKILKPNLGKIGYYTVAPKQITTPVHTLVTLAFLGKREKWQVVDHIDGNKLNNNINNLRYVTQKGNVANAIRLGAIPIGERCSWSKLKEADVKNILKDQRSLLKIAADYKINRTTVQEIKNRLIWKHITA